MRKSNWFWWVPLALFMFVLMTGGCGGGGGGGGGSNADNGGNNGGSNGGGNQGGSGTRPETPITTGNWVDYRCIDWFTADGGTFNNPFEINSAEQLAGVAYLSQNGTVGWFILVNDISLTGREWTPINAGVNLNGNGYTISNMTITSYLGSDTQVGRAGLFSENRGTIENVRLTNLYISGGNHSVGGITGVNWGRVVNSQASGFVSSSFQAGGIAGLNIGRYANIIDCVSNVFVMSEVVGGGIAGRSEGAASIINCISNSDVEVEHTLTLADAHVGGAAGGIVGISIDSRVEGCISNGNVNLVSTLDSWNMNSRAAGGIVGFNSADNASVVGNSKLRGSVRGVYNNPFGAVAFTGGIIGENWVGSGEISNNEFSRGQTGQNYAIGWHWTTTGSHPSNHGAVALP